MNENRLVVWLDPGKLTGLASWDESATAFRSWQYDEEDLMRRLWTLSELYEGRIALGWEKYIVTGGGGAKRGDAHYSQQVIGTVNTAARTSGWQILPSMPSSARALGSPAMLRRLGWHKPGKDHANDAAQHLLAYLLRQRPMSSHVRHKLFPGYDTGVTLAT
jgi:hypothetical protein